jgi:long-chain acyl-CoA synthetase
MRVARRNPEGLALKFPGQNLTFGALIGRVSNLAAYFFNAELPEGERVLLYCTNRPEFVETMLAIELAGLVAVPVPRGLAWNEVEGIIIDTSPSALILDNEVIKENPGFSAAGFIGLNHKLSIGAEFDGFIQYETAVLAAGPPKEWVRKPFAPIYFTSGTTGRVRGVVRARHDGGPLSRRIPAACSFESGDSFLFPIPLSNLAMFGVGVKIPLAAGVPVYILKYPSPVEILQAIDQYKISHVYLTPYLLYQIRNLGATELDKYKLNCLRVVLHAGAPCSADLKYWAINKFGEIITEFYAGTEGGGVIINSPEWLRKPGSVGRSLPDCPVRILDDSGKECPVGVSGHVYFEAEPDASFKYLGDPEKTASAHRGSCFTLGDLGYLDKDGYLFLTGRSAEICVIGGYNVFPEEIDECLCRHEEIQDAISVSVPVPGKGEGILCLVVPRDPIKDFSFLRPQLMAYCEQQLAYYKQPVFIDHIQEVPRSAGGKKLRQLAAQSYLSKPELADSLVHRITEYSVRSLFRQLPGD